MLRSTTILLLRILFTLGSCKSKKTTVTKKRTTRTERVQTKIPSKETSYEKPSPAERTEIVTPPANASYAEVVQAYIDT